MEINLAFTCPTVYPVGVYTSATYEDIKFPSYKFKKKKTGNGDRYTPSVTDLSAACFVTFLSVFFSTPASPFSKRGASIKAGDTSTALIGWQAVLIS